MKFKKFKSLNLINRKRNPLSSRLKKVRLEKNERVSNYDNKSQNFIDYLVESESEFTTLDILSDINLIPTASEIEDPISWAARTSLPPI